MRTLSLQLKACIGGVLLLANCCVFAQSEDKKVSDPLADKKNQTQQNIEWGAWDAEKDSASRYGVGIQGEIEEELSRLDRSNLLDNAEGVEVQNKNKSHASKPRDIKKLMAELEAMEAEIKQEINDESEF